MSDESAVLPQTATEAADAWFRGETLRAFRVNSEGASQEEIYAAAFQMIRDGNLPDSARDFEGLTIVEAQSAHSIAFVSLRQGWAATVLGHIHPNSPGITIKKPA
jgi:hypothetical protein